MPLLPLLAAVAAATTINVPATLGDRVQSAHDKSGLPVFLPETIPSYSKKNYGDGFAQKGQYDLTIGAAKNCGGANACAIAYFGGMDKGRPQGDVPIKLAKGHHGRFSTIHCGASCAPPEIEWRQRGNLYWVQIKGLSESSEKRVLRRAVNSAIRHGAR